MMVYKAVADCKKAPGCTTTVFCKGVIVDLMPNHQLTEKWLSEGALVPITEDEAKRYGILDQWRRGNEE
jgi:hypothetical protein